MLGGMSDRQPQAVHEHGREHGHGHDHDHGHAHDHDHGRGFAARLKHLLKPHSHEPADQVDAVMEGSTEGMRTLWISLAILEATAII